MSIVDSSLLAFIGVALLLAMTPGPDMATITRNGIVYGRRGVVLTALGIGTALLCWTVASALGVAALLAASGQLFTIVKLAGAGYLAYLGTRSIIQSFRHRGEPGGAGPAAPARRIYRTGFLSAIFNPKLGAVFVTLLPQFVEPGQPVLPRLLLLGAIFAAIGMIWLACYGTFVTVARDVVGRPRVRAWMERVSGVVLLGFAVRLGLEKA